MHAVCQYDALVHALCLVHSLSTRSTLSACSSASRCQSSSPLLCRARLLLLAAITLGTLSLRAADASAQCCQCARPSLFTGLGALFCRESLCRLLLPRKHLVAVLQYLGTLQARGYSPAAATLAGRDLPHSLRLPDRPVVTCRTRPPAWPACCDLPHLLRLPDRPLVAFRTRSA